MWTVIEHKSQKRKLHLSYMLDFVIGTYKVNHSKLLPYMDTLGLGITLCRGDNGVFHKSTGVGYIMVKIISEVHHCKQLLLLKSGIIIMILVPMNGVYEYLL